MINSIAPFNCLLTVVTRRIYRTRLLRRPPAWT